MRITGKSYIHCNYYLALEKDLSEVARYIEFSKNNFHTYSIELAHLLLASASEIDVVCKGICNYLEPGSNSNNINDYQKVINQYLPGLKKETVYIPRHNLEFKPWINWKLDKNPLWWKSYNNVKHQRNEFFKDANLINVLKSMSALLITTFYLYKLQFTLEINSNISNEEITSKLGLGSGFMRLNEDYYYEYLCAE